MKRIVLVFIIVSFFLSSCAEEAERVSYIWTGEEEIRHFVPVSIIWYKRMPPPLSSWRPYKCFSQAEAEKMRTIISRLTKPEKEEANPCIESEDKLSLVFYNGVPEKLTVREVYFKLEDGTFIGPLGKSDEVGTLLVERKEIKSYYYYPYSELGAGHYLFDPERVGESQRRLQGQAEAFKAHKEVEAQKRIDEANGVDF